MLGCAGLDCEWVGVGWYRLVWVLLDVVRAGVVQRVVGCAGGEVGSVVCGGNGVAGYGLAIGLGV